MIVAEVTDDDGVLVLASANSMRSRFAKKEFDYAFPVELLEGAKNEELCAWQTHEEGVATVRIHSDEQPPAEAQYLGVIRFATADGLLVLPYSQYTFACHARRGEPEKRDDVCRRIVMRPGRYGLWARLTPNGGSLSFDVFMTQAASSLKALEELPVIEPGPL